MAASTAPVNISLGSARTPEIEREQPSRRYSLPQRHYLTLWGCGILINIQIKAYLEAN